MDGFAQCILQSCAFAASLDSLQAPSPDWPTSAAGSKIRGGYRLKSAITTPRRDGMPGGDGFRVMTVPAGPEISALLHYVPNL